MSYGVYVAIALIKKIYCMESLPKYDIASKKLDSMSQRHDWSEHFNLVIFLLSAHKVPLVSSGLLYNGKAIDLIHWSDMLI